MWRCEQIRRRYGADVYIQVRYKNRHYEYLSLNDNSFPKSRAELVSSITPWSFHAKVVKKGVYPILVAKSLMDFEEKECPSEVKDTSG
ncbi:hypothetical protein CKAH01_19115 [Colletotrichum kahawae]|uniref:Uncharacterized protein n=1 Tax=Colletotrichum kahawae TaxID=34407 RepID=A0AAD9Y123_COLKA|nr:hypothetical protein CKAH01_19115 [Colletotrichum kahawae]